MVRDPHTRHFLSNKFDDLLNTTATQETTVYVEMSINVGCWNDFKIEAAQFNYPNSTVGDDVSLPIMDRIKVS